MRLLIFSMHNLFVMLLTKLSASYLSLFIWNYPKQVYLEVIFILIKEASFQESVLRTAALYTSKCIPVYTKTSLKHNNKEPWVLCMCLSVLIQPPLSILVVNTGCIVRGQICWPMPTQGCQNV